MIKYAYDSVNNSTTNRVGEKDKMKKSYNSRLATFPVALLAMIIWFVPNVLISADNPAFVTITPEPINVGEGHTFTATGTARPADQYRRITFEMFEDGMATVTPGTATAAVTPLFVKGITAGTTRLKGLVDGVLKTSVQVNVIKVSAEFDASSIAVCLGKSAPLTVKLNWFPTTFTDHPVSGVYEFNSTDSGLEICHNALGPFGHTMVPTTVTSDTATIYMKGTELGTFKPRVKWNASYFSAPEVTTSVIVNPYISGYTKGIPVPPTPPNGSIKFTYDQYPIAGVFNTHLMKCNAQDTVTVHGQYNLISSPEGGYSHVEWDYTMEPGEVTYDRIPDLHNFPITNLVAGPHLIKAYAKVSVTFVAPFELNHYPYPVFSETNSSTMDIRSIFPQP